MPRYIFSAGSVTNTTGGPLRLTFHATSTNTRRETDLWTLDGSNYISERIPNGVIVVDSTGAYSAFAGPDDIDTLYLGANGGSRSAINATGITTGQGGTYLSGTYAQRVPTISSVTRDAFGRLQSWTEAGVAISVTRSADGLVQTITSGGVTHAVTRDASNRVTGVS